MKLISVKIPEAYLVGLNVLVNVKKRYPNRSEAIRVAIRDLLKKELWGEEVPTVDTSGVPIDRMLKLLEE